jgi:hypothetical protein
MLYDKKGMAIKTWGNMARLDHGLHGEDAKRMRSFVPLGKNLGLGNFLGLFHGTLKMDMKLRKVFFLY